MQLLRKLLFSLLLTLLTQVGGLIYLFYQPISKVIQNRWKGKRGLLFRGSAFIVSYLSITLLLIPPLAKQWGRVPMPYFATNKVPLKPRTIFTCLLNRHYVKPALSEQITQIARVVKRTTPDRQIVYLDANFPFWDGFPLLPHLSHNDGKKLDLAFLYKDKDTGKLINESPSFYGYGVFEGPRKGELNQPNICAKKGAWQYGILEKITPQGQKDKVVVDESATKQFLELLAKNKAIKKIFIEPHLKNRWQLTRYDKIRYHGCHAVRHDDHIHIQL